MKKTLKYLILSSIISIGMYSISCNSSKVNSDKKTDLSFSENRYRIMFYNIENLFDTINDPKKRDDEFTPDGARRWNTRKYKEKLNNIYKVITSIGEWNAPYIVGLCEVENRVVLEDLVNKTPLHKEKYEIIHYESPDARGIDVALLYRKDYFDPIKTGLIRIVWPKEIGSGTTRDILYVSGLTDYNDTLHVFFNHWPSRWGGQKQTENKRMYVADQLKKSTDSIFAINPESNIIIMGDFNDYPSDKSITDHLKAHSTYENAQKNELYNLSYYLQEVKKKGTLKFQGKWGILDQIIVSGHLLDTTKTPYTTKDHAVVYDADFLLEKDPNFPGKTLRRTYVGYKYNGGPSDHLPIYIDLIYPKKK